MGAVWGLGERPLLAPSPPHSPAAARGVAGLGEGAGVLSTWRLAVLPDPGSERRGAGRPRPRRIYGRRALGLQWP